jgi:hypothetical protein
MPSAAGGNRPVVAGETKSTESCVPDPANREKALRHLADQLLFSVEKQGDRFTLTRTADVSRPVRHAGLTLEDAEELLNTWKLRGAHGG